jgi:phosphoglycolate phosphatase
MNDLALIFDLDGTLVDSLPDLRAALNDMLLGLGRRRLAVFEVRPMIGDGTRALVQRALGATGGVAGLEEAHSAFLEFYGAGLTRLTRLYPGVRESLPELRRSGARLGVCTNKSQAMSIAVLEAFGISNDFAAIVGGDAVPLRKPNPAHLHAVVKQLGARLRDAVMIGDGVNDYAAARALGIPVILMSYGYLRVPRGTVAPDEWLKRFVDIPEAVNRIRVTRELKPVLV